MVLSQAEIEAISDAVVRKIDINAIAEAVARRIGVQQEVDEDLRYIMSLPHEERKKKLKERRERKDPATAG